MILDKLLQFADRVNIFGAAGNVAMGSVLDFVYQGGKEPQIGPAMFLVIQKSADIGGGAANSQLQFTLTSAATAAGAGTVQLQTPLMSKAEFNSLNAPIAIPINITLPFRLMQRYWRLRVSRVGATTTSGSVSAWITCDVPQGAITMLPDAAN